MLHKAPFPEHVCGLSHGQLAALTTIVLVIRSNPSWLWI